MMLKLSLLVLLGAFWSMRLSAIKAAGLSGIPAYAVVAVSTLGIAAFFSGAAVVKKTWPPITRTTLTFYSLSGALGFIVPFLLESLVAPKLPLFVLVVIIATMPLITLVLSAAFKHEVLDAGSILAVVLGFLGSIAVLWDTAHTGPVHGVSLVWVGIAFGIPTLYALNTVFVATRWPSSVNATQVAHGQALIMSAAALLGSLASGSVNTWALAVLNIPAMSMIVVCEGLALLTYLKIARDYGATYVSFANYISIVFAAVIGMLVFDDRITGLSMAATGTIIAAVAIYQARSSVKRG